MSLHFPAFIFPLLTLIVTVCSAFPDDRHQLVKLAYKVSEAAYSNGPLTNCHSQIMSDRTHVGCPSTGWKGERHHFFKTDETAVIFLHSTRRLAVIGFRGTDSYTDWKDNFQINQVQVGRPHVKIGLHAGFFQRYRYIREWFETRYTSLRSENYRIIITGHSLGGAMAKIASTFAAGNLFSPPEAVITFAAPKVGDTDFKTFYETRIGCHKTVKVEVQCDPIVKLPPWSYDGVCNAVKIKRGSIPDPLSCHSITGHYGTGLQTRYGSNLQRISMACDHFPSNF